MRGTLAASIMPEKPEAQPEDDDVAAVVGSVLVPLLERLRTEVNHPLRVNVQIVRNGELVREITGVGDSGTDGQAGTARIRFRETGFPGRRLFFLQALFETDPRVPAFSGFTCRGAVECKEDESVASFSTWSVNREDARWLPWL